MIEMVEMDDDVNAKTTRISLTEAKQQLGELVKRVAYGGESVRDRVARKAPARS